MFVAFDKDLGFLNISECKYNIHVKDETLIDRVGMIFRNQLNHKDHLRPESKDS